MDLVRLRLCVSPSFSIYLCLIIVLFIFISHFGLSLFLPSLSHSVSCAVFLPHPLLFLFHPAIHLSACVLVCLNFCICVHKCRCDVRRLNSFSLIDPHPLPLQLHFYALHTHTYTQRLIKPGSEKHHLPIICIQTMMWTCCFLKS